jgi:hypothetical protein
MNGLSPRAFQLRDCLEKGSVPYLENRHSIGHIQGHHLGLLSGFDVSSIVSLSMSFGLLAFQEVSTLNMA